MEQVSCMHAIVRVSKLACTAMDLCKSAASLGQHVAQQVVLQMCMLVVCPHLQSSNILQLKLQRAADRLSFTW